MNFKTDKIILAVFLIISAALAFLPSFVKSEYLLRLIAVVILWIGLAGCWNMMSGYTGYIDFGPVVYFGIGSYVVAIAMTKYGIPFFPSLGSCRIGFGHNGFFYRDPDFTLEGSLFCNSHIRFC